MPTPSTTPNAVRAERSGRVRSWRNAIELKERSIGRPKRSELALVTDCSEAR